MNRLSSNRLGQWSAGRGISPRQWRASGTRPTAEPQRSYPTADEGRRVETVRGVHPGIDHRDEHRGEQRARNYEDGGCPVDVPVSERVPVVYVQHESQNLKEEREHFGVEQDYDPSLRDERHECGEQRHKLDCHDYSARCADAERYDEHLGEFPCERLVDSVSPANRNELGCRNQDAERDTGGDQQDVRPYGERKEESYERHHR